jgi:hypothetical protein
MIQPACADGRTSMPRLSSIHVHVVDRGPIAEVIGGSADN